MANSRSSDTRVDVDEGIESKLTHEILKYNREADRIKANVRDYILATIDENEPIDDKLNNKILDDFKQDPSYIDYMVWRDYANKTANYLLDKKLNHITQEVVKFEALLQSKWFKFFERDNVTTVYDTTWPYVHLVTPYKINEKDFNLVNFWPDSEEETLDFLIHSVGMATIELNLEEYINNDSWKKYSLLRKFAFILRFWGIFTNQS